jgi:hypothetical protein
MDQRGELFALAQQAVRLGYDLLAKRGKSHHAPRPLDKGDAEQRFQFA